MLSRAIGVAPAAFAAGLCMSGSLTATAAWGQQDASEQSAVTLASFEVNGQARAITQAPVIDPDVLSMFYSTYAACGTTCIAPATAAPDVQTIAEPEVISFVTDVVASGQGILLDGRSAQDRALGHIATSVNVPLSLVSPDNPYFGQILEALGAQQVGEAFDFASALPLVVFDAGPTTNDAEALIGALMDAGYPAEKIQYYRGGMQIWVALGLSFEE